VVEQDNNDKLLIPGEITEYEMDWDPIDFAKFLEDVTVGYYNFINPRVETGALQYFSTFISILRTEGIVEIDDTTSDEEIESYLYVYFINYSDNPQDDRLVFINWRKKENKTVVYSVNPEEEINFLERYLRYNEKIAQKKLRTQKKLDKLL
jgi:hypothetical protein